jgi:hypothetical protein
MIELKAFDLQLFEKIKDSTAFNLKNLLDMTQPHLQAYPSRHISSSSSNFSDSERKNSAFKRFTKRPAALVPSQSTVSSPRLVFSCLSI